MKIAFQLLCLLPALILLTPLPAAEPEGCPCAAGIPLGLPTDSECATCVDKPQVILVGIGGWKSCLGSAANDQYISNRFLCMVKELRRSLPDWNVNYIMYCSPGLKTIREDGEVQRYSDLRGSGMVAERNIGSSIASHKSSPDSKVFVMGHSHGGWMAMRATICLGQVDGLFTLEPVSANQCTTKDYLTNRTRKIFKGRQKIVPGCRRAPVDVDRMAVLSAAGGNWTNFFLAPNTQKGDIYSSPIPETHNHMIWAPAKGKYNAHHNLGLSAEVWSTIQASILGHLSSQVPANMEVPSQAIPIRLFHVSPDEVFLTSGELGGMQRVRSLRLANLSISSMA